MGILLVWRMGILLVWRMGILLVWRMGILPLAAAREVMSCYKTG
jgi:hypothetical protein